MGASDKIENVSSVVGQPHNHWVLRYYIYSVEIVCGGSVGCWGCWCCWCRCNVGHFSGASTSNFLNQPITIYNFIENTIQFDRVFRNWKMRPRQSFAFCLCVCESKIDFVFFWVKWDFYGVLLFDESHREDLQYWEMRRGFNRRPNIIAQLHTAKPMFSLREHEQNQGRFYFLWHLDTHRKKEKEVERERERERDRPKRNKSRKYEISSHHKSVPYTFEPAYAADIQAQVKTITAKHALCVCGELEVFVKYTRHIANNW